MKKEFCANLTAALPASPATAFISGVKPEPEGEKNGSASPLSAAKSAKVSDGGLDVRETKSARVQLLMRPSLVERLKHLAKGQGVSLNELVNMELSKL